MPYHFFERECKLKALEKIKNDITFTALGETEHIMTTSKSLWIEQKLAFKPIPIQPSKNSDSKKKKTNPRGEKCGKKYLSVQLRDQV